MKNPPWRPIYPAIRALQRELVIFAAMDRRGRNDYASPRSKHWIGQTMSLSSALATIVGHATRHAGRTVLLGLVIAGLCLLATVERLGVSTDTDALFAPSLPWRQRDMAFDRDFPQFHDQLVAVIDAHTPEMADQTAADLALAMAADKGHFKDVRRPDASPFLEAHGLLFLEEKQLTELLDGTIDAQPFLGQLSADPSARGLFAALGLVGLGVERGQADLAAFAKPLQAFHVAIAAALAGKPEPLSWQSLLAGSLSDQAGPYHFVLATPVLDFNALEPGGAAGNALRAAAAKLEFVKTGQAHVRITGSVALADEEFATVAQGAALGTAASALLVLLWLVLAVRSWRLIVPIMASLLVGLIITTGFAALVVGRLNLVSIAFAILFVGIAVDFAIQFCVRYRAVLRSDATGAAMTRTGFDVGPQILVAALGTAAGFLAFVPTDFSGVAELGLIAGMGMVIAFATTLLFLPALLHLFRAKAVADEVGFAWGRPAEALLVRRGRVVLLGFALIALLGAALSSRIVFDSDPLHTKNTQTEAMRTLYDLMANPFTNPYSAEVILPDLAAADALAARLRALPLVSEALTLSSFVPDDQAPKIALLADAATILGPTLAPRAPPVPVRAADIRLAARAAFSALDRAAQMPAGAPLVPILNDLRAMSTADDAVLMSVNASLTRFLPLQLARLRQGLEAAPVKAGDIPKAFAQDWILPDGRARVQVLSRPAAQDSKGLHDFVAQVRTITADAGGSAVTIVETSNTITHAFVLAAIYALIAIAVLLLVVLRRVLDAVLVLAPLLLSALMTVVIAVLLPLPLNFANIIALPLLLGVGVSFNIYFVMNWRAGAASYLDSPTARAILFSALTTATAFSSLALSGHPGTASMGLLLLISLGCTLLVTLVFMPPLLRALPSR
jgi:hopanoid biosynthesis associated RND transporter like protein HpnN